MSSSLSTVATGIKFGLIKRGQSQNQKVFSASAAPQRKPVAASFRDELEDDDEEDAVDNITRVNRQLQVNGQKSLEEMNRMAKVAQLEDPNIFDFDGTYELYKRPEKVSSQIAQKEAPKSRYVQNLKSTASVREKERDRVYEKKLLKEREVEDKEFGDQPKFMTSAYKKKLIEDKKWEYENMLGDKLDEKTDVRSSGMEGFYKNLLTKNISMGSSVDGNAVSVYTAGSTRQSKLQEEQQQQQQPQEARAKDSEKALHLDDNSESESASENASDPAAGRPISIAQSSSSSIIPVSGFQDSHSLDQQQQQQQQQKAPLVSKEEQVELARQRYLERKRKLEEERG